MERPSRVDFAFVFLYVSNHKSEAVRESDGLEKNVAFCRAPRSRHVFAESSRSQPVAGFPLR